MGSEHKQKGFEFPGVFEITAMGPASAVLHETVRSRASTAGRFVSISISFKANSRADYDAAHLALRAHPEVKWTL